MNMAEFNLCLGDVERGVLLIYGIRSHGDHSGAVSVSRGMNTMLCWGGFIIQTKTYGLCPVTKAQWRASEVVPPCQIVPFRKNIGPN